MRNDIPDTPYGVAIFPIGNFIGTKATFISVAVSFTVRNTEC